MLFCSYVELKIVNYKIKFWKWHRAYKFLIDLSFTIIKLPIQIDELVLEMMKIDLVQKYIIWQLRSRTVDVVLVSQDYFNYFN